MMRALLASLLLASSAGAYVRSQTPSGTALEWGRRCIGYHVHDGGSDDVVLEQVVDAARKSFAAWQDVQCSDLELHYLGLTNDGRVGYHPSWANINVVVFRETEEAWPHASGVIALTTATFCTDPSNSACPVGRVVDADIEMNGADFAFSTSPLPRLVRFDIRNTITHEAGHFIGLDHTPVETATMYASAPAGERSKATLDPDDVEGMCAIYPAGEAAECEPFSVEGDHYVSDAELNPDHDEGCSTAPGGGAPLLALLLLWFRRDARAA